MTKPRNQYDDAFFDQDGYPHGTILDKIEAWPYTDPHGLMELVQALWHWGENQYEQHTEDDDLDRAQEVYTFHTGGWSGNEQIIQALSNNQMFWLMNWYSSRRGGHFVFKVRVPNGK